MYARGYLTPEGAMPPLEVIADPAFAWPDLPIPMHGSVTMRTGAPELRAVNATVYGFTGTVNVGIGPIRVRTTSLPQVLVG